MKVHESRAAAFEEFVNQFKAETDRAAVILCASKLDTLLYQLINHFLVPNYSKSDDLFDGDGPLSTLSSRINLCFRLGIIDAQFAKALHMVRKLRNDFAHEVTDTRLDAPPHRDRIRELSGIVSAYAFYRDIRRTYFEDKVGPAADFFSAATLLIASLDAIFPRIQPLPGAKAYSIATRQKRRPRKAT